MACSIWLPSSRCSTYSAGFSSRRFDDDLALRDLICGTRMRRAVDRDRVELALPEVIDRVVVRDLQDPVTELVAGLVRADRVERPDEGLLGQIFREGPVPDHPVDEREDRALVSDQKFAKRRLVAARRVRRELSIVEVRVVQCGQRCRILPGVRQPAGGGSRQGSAFGTHRAWPYADGLGFAGFDPTSGVEAASSLPVSFSAPRRGRHPVGPLKATRATEPCHANNSDAAPKSGAEREKQVQQIFSEIAPRYDLLNHVLSLNIDRSWRRKAIDMRWSGRSAARRGRTWTRARVRTIWRSNWASRPSLRFRARSWRPTSRSRCSPQGLTQDRPPLRFVRPVCGDSLGPARSPTMPSTARPSVSEFGIWRDLEQGLVGVPPRSQAGAADSSSSSSPCRPIRIMRAGLPHVLPPRPSRSSGAIVSGHPWAYTYLPESVKEFPGPKELVGIVRRRWVSTDDRMEAGIGRDRRDSLGLCLSRSAHRRG